MKWFGSYHERLQSVVNGIFPYRGEIRILILGCGNSALSRDLADDGYTNVVSLDYSRVCIESMRRLHATSHPYLEWVEGDVRDLPFADGSFDLAIDKVRCRFATALSPVSGSLLTPCAGHTGRVDSAWTVRRLATLSG